MAEKRIRTKSQIRAIYKTTHNDYKMKLKDGTLMSMWFDNGTVLGPIEDMPEEIFQERLKRAIKKANDYKTFKRRKNSNL